MTKSRTGRQVIDGLKGGLLANSYIRIADPSRATVTRDLRDIFENGVAHQDCALHFTRYFFSLLAEVQL